MKAKIDLLEKDLRASRAKKDQDGINMQRRSITSTQLSGGILKHNSSTEFLNVLNETKVETETLANHYTDPTTTLVRAPRIGAIGIMLNEPSITSFQNQQQQQTTMMYSMNSERVIQHSSAETQRMKTNATEYDSGIQTSGDGMPQTGRRHKAMLKQAQLQNGKQNQGNSNSMDKVVTASAIQMKSPYLNASKSKQGNLYDQGDMQVKVKYQPSMVQFQRLGQPLPQGIESFQQNAPPGTALAGHRRVKTQMGMIGGNINIQKQSYPTQGAQYMLTDEKKLTSSFDSKPASFHQQPTYIGMGGTHDHHHSQSIDQALGSYNQQTNILSGTYINSNIIVTHQKHLDISSSMNMIGGKSSKKQGLKRAIIGANEIPSLPISQMQVSESQAKNNSQRLLIPTNEIVNIRTGSYDLNNNQSNSTLTAAQTKKVQGVQMPRALITNTTSAQKPTFNPAPNTQTHFINHQQQLMHATARANLPTQLSKNATQSSILGDGSQFGNSSSFDYVRIHGASAGVNSSTTRPQSQLGYQSNAQGHQRRLSQKSTLMMGGAQRQKGMVGQQQKRGETQRGSPSKQKF